ncbi:PIG-L family deacetylase, partial [Candidatus Dojkabacteria bacterium]|nr:PIG-L family deacetylase [Candidatus Dojkabacteria bacterium]
MLELLFIGAHHDDIEIGTAGTLAKFVSQGHKVSAFILTDEDTQEEKELRRNETVQSLARLGLSENNILFGGFFDGKLMDDRESISRLRGIVADNNLKPDIVFCHTTHDSHNDHRRCYLMALSCFRESVVLCYPIVNSLIPSSFHPHFFVDTTDFYEKKLDALKMHKSQINNNRIKWDEIEKLDGNYGVSIGAKYAEGFEVIVQAGGEVKEKILLYINDSPFHKLWWHLIGDQDLYYIHSLPRIGSKPDIDNWIPNKDRVGAAQLRENLVQHYDYKRFIEIPSSHHKVEQVIESENILLGGGPVNNIVTRNYFNHFPNIRYIVDYDMPGYQNVRVLDRYEKVIILPNYTLTKEGKRILLEDFGILTIMRNIVCKSHQKILI